MVQRVYLDIETLGRNRNFYLFLGNSTYLILSESLIKSLLRENCL